MVDFATQLEEMLKQRMSNAPRFINDQRSALQAAAGQEQQSIDQLRGIYSDPSKFERSPWGAMGLGLMKGTKSGTFNEGMFNGLAAATAAQDYNREQNLSREEKLAKLVALEGALTRQKATDERTLYDTQSGVIQNGLQDQGTYADLQLQDQQLGSRPLGPGEAGPVAPDQSVEAQAEMIYQDYMRNPQKYQGAQGQAMVKNAITTLSNVRNNQTRLQVAQTRGGGNKPTVSGPEQRRLSGRMKELDAAAEDARALRGSVSSLRMARSKTDSEGGMWADTRATVGGWFGTDNAAAMQQVRAGATDMRLDLSSKLKGAISNAEQAMLENATPGLNMTDEAAGPVLDGFEMAAIRVTERSKFMKQWIRQNGDDYGADEAWDRYVNENPIIEADQSGGWVLNKENIGGWQGYVVDVNSEDGPGPNPPNQYPDNPDEVVGRDANGQDITWGDIQTTAEENNMTVEEVIQRLQGGK